MHRARQADARHDNCDGFNGLMRDDLLHETLFVVIDHACEAVACWTHSENTERPHSARGYQPPAVLAEQLYVVGDQLCASEPVS